MKIFYLVIVLTCFSCQSLQKKVYFDICRNSNFYQTVEKVSIDDIDRIKKLNGKFVEIEGYFYENFEDVALYPNWPSYTSAGALWLNLVVSDSLADKLSKTKVRVIGRVNLSEKGHLGAYLATLDSTFCMIGVPYE